MRAAFGILELSKRLEQLWAIRITDAGSETTTYNSRVQVSLDGGATWFYDTSTDDDLPNGWRLNGAGRYLLWDVAPDAGPVTERQSPQRVCPQFRFVTFSTLVDFPFFTPPSPARAEPTFSNP